VREAHWEAGLTGDMANVELPAAPRCVGMDPMEQIDDLEISCARLPPRARSFRHRRSVSMIERVRTFGFSRRGPCRTSAQAVQRHRRRVGHVAGECIRRCEASGEIARVPRSPGPGSAARVCQQAEVIALREADRKADSGSLTTAAAVIRPRAVATRPLDGLEGWTAAARPARYDDVRCGIEEIAGLTRPSGEARRVVSSSGRAE